MLVGDFASTFRAKSDDELLQLAEDADQMSPEAVVALRGELAHRRIEPSNSSPSNLTARTTQASVVAIAPQTAPSIASFIENILAVYRSHFWVFFQLSAVGVVASYVTLAVRRYEVREIFTQFSGRLWSLNVRALVEVSLLDVITAFLIWAATFFALATISSAVEQTKTGRPSVHESIRALMKHLSACVRLSLLLFLALGVLLIIIGIAAGGAFWALQRAHLRPGYFEIIIASSLVAVLGLLPFSRLILAVPAVVLDGIELTQAIFLSDEITEGKWLILAVLLIKWLIAGYIAGVLPFWIRFWIWRCVQIPDWVAVAGSLLAVTAVEPTLFIGLALLYLREKNTAQATGAAYSTAS
jgi:hypothetical protein